MNLFQKCHIFSTKNPFSQFRPKSYDLFPVMGAFAPNSEFLALALFYGSRMTGVMRLLQDAHTVYTTTSETSLLGHTSIRWYYMILWTPFCSYVYKHHITQSPVRRGKQNTSRGLNSPKTNKSSASVKKYAPIRLHKRVIEGLEIQLVQ